MFSHFTMRRTGTPRQGRLRGRLMVTKKAASPLNVQNTVVSMGGTCALFRPAPIRQPATISAAPARVVGVSGSLNTNQPMIDAQIKARSEEHTSELQSLMRISYAVFCLKKKKKIKHTNKNIEHYLQ